MPANWTEFDPGSGDLASCDAARLWAEQQYSDLSDAQSAVTTILRDLDATWTGESADAFRGRAARLRRDLEGSSEAMDAARKAMIEYGDAVAEIARSAEPLKEDLAAAALILDGVRNGVLFDNDAEGLEHRFQAEQRAMADSKAAAEGLAELAQRRRVADAALASSLARLSSSAWGGIGCTAEPTVSASRDRANARVMDLFEWFRTGDGPRGLVLGPDDPFVAMLMKSEHIEAVRDRVLSDLREARLREGDAGVEYDRIISNDGFVLIKDLLYASASVMTGEIPGALLSWQNLPQSFLGSYDLTVYAGTPQTDGGVSTTYVINNDTTSDSATRIPGTGGAHMPIVYEAMLEAETSDGAWAAQHQTIVWTEVVYP
ncbi:WXG100 family type VII secretion target [Microbacterium sp. H83]|uniref:WXG100 family type VII secretion target n=1 Tax=Microbacterium sp. H83 TaxID=1827324 RepID=UPI0007F3ED41|nr:hypothetical protein [Microbacterium sp. H83]OAN41661.1 hypothetical protein A4X16_10690 [Microbacterium sp. H83]